MITQPIRTNSFHLNDSVDTLVTISENNYHRKLHISVFKTVIKKYVCKMLFILKIMKKQKQFQRCTVKEVFFVAWQVFSCEFYEISTNTFFYRNLQWLRLKNLTKLNVTKLLRLRSVSCRPCFQDKFVLMFTQMFLRVFSLF